MQAAEARVQAKIADLFVVAGKSYRVVFTLTPTAGQVILVRFRLAAI